MRRLDQSPTEDAFVQNPYQFYTRARRNGPLFYWNDYGRVAAAGHAAVTALLRDRRLGRETPAGMARRTPDRLRPFQDIEDNSMLELEPPRHTRLRNLVLRAFTPRRIAALEPGIAALCHRLVDAFPGCGVDLVRDYARPIPVIVIARLLGVPDERADDLLDWSNAMVRMYQAGRTRGDEDAAVAATESFTAFLNGHIDERRARPKDDLISHLIAAEAEGDGLSRGELVSTCVLLLNAGHEATVHSLGNAAKLIIERGVDRGWLASGSAAAAVEECLRLDPPLHAFNRWAYEDVEIAGHTIPKNTEVMCLLGSANRDADAYSNPDEFDPDRGGPTTTTFGGGIHFCVGAALARLELRVALSVLFDRRPDLSLAEAPRYAPIYHFRGLESLRLR